VRFKLMLARCMMSRECPPKLFHSSHLHIQLCNLLTHSIAHPPAFVSATCSKKPFDLLKRKTQLLSLLDKPDALD
jgi:hypothetical protein